MKSRPRPANLADRLFTRAEAYAEGLTSQELSEPEWKHVLRRVYASSSLHIGHTELCHALTMVRDTRRFCFAGSSAAWLLGLRMPKPPATVHVLVSRSDLFGPMKSVAVHTSSYPITNHARILPSGWRCTRPLKTAWDIACWLPTVDSIGFLDAMCAAGWFTPQGISEFATQQPQVKGSNRAGFVISRTVADSGSPAESRLRIKLAGTGLPSPLLNYRIESGGEFVAIVDFAWPDFKLALEYDGIYHAGPVQMERDRSRLNRLIADGWTIMHATRVHVYGSEFPMLLEQLRRALSQVRR